MTLPTTIDLNPVDEDGIRAYYSDLEGKKYQGEDLLQALKPILKNGQKYHSYDQNSGKNNAIWKSYEITDRDWTLSPAGSDSVGNYDPDTGIITDYKYGINNPYQHLYYRNRGVEAGYQRAWDHHGDNNGTDREHLWAKGHGFAEKKQETTTIGAVPGARGDLHHLVAADSYVNSSTHNAYSYGFVDPTKIAEDAATAYQINNTVVVAGNYRGTSQTLGTGTVFEPQDCDKGDIARALFYMVARYNNLAGDDDTIDSGNPNLELSDVLAPAESFISTTSEPGRYGILRDLLAWHHLDPVDEYEIHRNDLIYRNYDSNRNPFIDFPEWVDYVWGTSTLDEDGRTIITRDETPTGYADPSKDVVYGYSEDPVDPPTPIPEEPEEQADVWTKAVSLSDGDEICFVNESAGYAMSDLASGNKAFATVESTAGKLSDHCLSEELGHTFSIEANNDGTFHLKYSDGHYLSYSTSSPYLGTAASGNINWTLANLDGTPLIQNTANANRWLGYNYNSGNPRFGLYANTTNYPCPSVYVKGVCNAASGYGERFCSEWTSGCKESGTYDGDKMDWEAATSAYNALSTRTQQFLTAASKDNPYVGDALAKYDYIVGKYGVDLFPDFLGRNPVSVSGALKVSQAHVSGSYIVILAILGGGAALATLLLVLSKRRRHQA